MARPEKQVSKPVPGVCGHVHVIGADAIAPSTYNPRKAIADRLELVDLSLRKLGFLLPIYATPEGEIVSGHQRHFVATQRLGWDVLPVQRIPSMSLDARRRLNIAFNRGTNDMDPNQVPADVIGRLDRDAVVAQLQSLPDVTDDGRFPCATGRMVNTAELIKRTGAQMEFSRFVVARNLRNDGALMPVVVDEGMRLINGHGRLLVASYRRETEVWTVVVPNGVAGPARAMLNYLTMEFDIHTRYADELRYNSRKLTFGGTKRMLGRVMTIGLPPRKGGWDLSTADQKRAWSTRFGISVLDFGAGLLGETKILQAAGVDCTPFEPFTVGRQVPGSPRDTPDLKLSKESALAFLGRVASNTIWQSIFVSAVMNSVPFQEDRRHIVCLLAALCSRPTSIFSHSQQVGNAHSQSIMGRTALNASSAMCTNFRLDYEPNVSLSCGQTFKMQKYWTPAEYEQLWRESFAVVSISASGQDVYAVCRSPKPLDVNRLRQAIEYEFDLPHPGGKRLGLVAEAKSAFARRLNIAL